MKLSSKGMKTRKCPGCGQRGQLREVLYGFPASEPDETRYTLGGCTLVGDEYDIRCISCNWGGLKDRFPSAKEVAEGSWTPPLIN